jgi:diguanylate cyclase (GGDEF)-like protein
MAGPVAPLLGWDFGAVLAVGLVALAVVAFLAGRRSRPMTPGYPTSTRTRDSALRRLLSRRAADKAGPVDPAVDSLTGLGHRVVLEERAPDLLAVAKRKGQVAAVLLLDADGFKALNDGLGHHAGDRILAETGSRIRACLRPGEIGVRLGGDEFAMMLGPLEDDTALDDRVHELLGYLAAPVLVDDLRVSVGISVGSAISGPDGRTLEELLRAADQAMYAAKAAGTGQWRRSEGPDAHTDQQRLSQQLRGALERSELTLHYQPQVEGWTGAVTGFEALIRWDHPDLGLLLPGQFLPMAERTGLIGPVTLFALDHALEDHVRLARLVPNCTVSVNVSARSMMGEGLLRDLERLLSRRGVPPGDLVLEITEPAPRPTPEVVALLDGIRRLGCRVSVHGFGSASSSLTGLWQYPALREIKIDPSIIHSLGTDPETERLVRAMISGAHSLDMRVVAEGVETLAVAQRLRRLGCDGLQGHWIGEPLALTSLQRWLEAWPSLRPHRLGT